MKLSAHAFRRGGASICLFLALFLFPGISSYAQQTIRGTVTDEATQTPMIGVSVLVKGASVGAVTDLDGNFDLMLPKDATTLVFSFVGYETVEETVAGRTIINVVLRENVSQLDEVVVIGYGQQQKKDLTTAVATLSAKEIRDVPVNSFDQILTGKMAGVLVQQPSGSPGAGVSVRVRGVGSITAGNDPLYVIDGVPVSADNNRGVGSNNPGSSYAEQPVNVLSTLNPADIESIQVLKDASAAAIYGSRGSNGVVLITTKKGKAGKAVVSYNTYVGMQETLKRYDMLNAYEWSQINFEGRNNAYRDRFPAGKDSDDNTVRAKNVANQPGILIPPQVQPYLSGTAGLTNTDWQDEIFRQAPIQDHVVSVSGGTENFRYYASGEYMDQQGVVISSGFKRYNGRFNMDLQSGKLKVGLNINPTLTQHDLVNSEGPWFDEGVIGLALSISPIWPVYNADGTYNYDANAWGFAMTDFLNPVALANQVEDNMDQLRLLGNAYAEYSILKNLSYRLSFGTDINNFNRQFYRPSTLETRGRKGASAPIGTSRTRFSSNWLVENLLNYNTVVGKHNLSAVAGFSSQKENFFSNYIEGTNYPNDLVQTINAAGQITSASSFKEAWSLLSALGRVQYSYNDKYYFSAAVRADGSSRFGANNKWGYFPSASAGWRVSGEPFMQSLEFLSNLKLRASYGVTGNFQIPNYGSVGLLSFDDYILGGTALSSGLAPSTSSNPDLSWEKTKSIDVGIDLGLFEDALYIELDYYKENTTDLLLNVPVPMTSGFNTELRNIGEVENKGFEATMTVQKRTKAFGWSFTANFSANQNKVISLAEGVPQILTAGGTGVTLWITKPGEEIGSYYNPVYDGVFNNQAEIDAYPHVANAKPGDFRFLDLNGDGKIDFASDRQIQGSYFPDFTYGATLNMDYKGFDFSAAMQGSDGAEILHLMSRYIYNIEGNMNLVRPSLNRWVSESQPGNGQTNRANRLATGSNGQTSNWHMDDGSYMRIRNITLGYTFPRLLVQRAKISNLRAYVSVLNPFLFTDYIGYNPEVNSRPDNALNPGEDYGSYPLARTYTFGLNLSF
ncbi:MAG: TonB-dependent receptor [Haliscomenobacter sp.]|nr:TonB-dependent receptor [Haliscomenobacter sp.]